jgi:predicted small lipoprotein YifL
MILFLLLGLANCGKKGPPVPPDDEPKKEKQESSYP